MRALQQRDTQSWFYKEPYIGDFHDKIAEEIQNCDVLIVLISRAALASKWVKQEVTLAMELERAIVPVELETMREEDFRGVWSFLRASKNFLRLNSADQAGIDQLADCIAAQLNPEVLIAGQENAAIVPPAPAPRKVRKWLPRRPRPWAAIAAATVLVAAAGAGYAWALPGHVNKTLTQQSHLANYQACYEEAKSWQGSMLLCDKSIPAYWRVAAFQSMHFDDCFKRHDPQAIDQLEQEYREALRLNQRGSKAAGILYQYAQFKRRTGDTEAALQLLTLAQAQYPNCAWKEGTAYYLAQMALARGNMVEAGRQVQKLEAMPLDARIFEFDAGKYISVGDGLVALRQQVAAAPGEAF
jgi:tetratricopeptide (TPR) repeat protein